MVKDWVKKITEESFGNPYIPVKGENCLLTHVHPGSHKLSEEHYPVRDGNNNYIGWRELDPPEHVTITRGEYWAEGGLSNFWYWYLSEDKDKRELCGYAAFKQ